MPDNNKKQYSFLKDSSVYLTATTISSAISFITLPVYTKYLTPSDYGVVAIFIMFGQVSSNLLSIGIQNASYRYYFKYDGNNEVYKTLYSTNLVFLLFIYLIGALGIYYLANWFSSTIFGDQISSRLIRLSFLSGCMHYFISYFTLILTAQKRSLAYAIITVSQALIKMAVSFYFIFMYSFKYMALIYATLLTQGLMIVCLLIISIDLLSIRFSLSNLKESIRYSFPLIPRQVIGLIYQSFDKTMLTNYTGLVSVGYYTFGEKFASILKLAMDSFSKVWSPFFLNKANENTKQARESIAKRFIQLAFFLP